MLNIRTPNTITKNVLSKRGQYWISFILVVIISFTISINDYIEFWKRDIINIENFSISESMKDNMYLWRYHPIINNSIKFSNQNIYYAIEGIAERRCDVTKDAPAHRNIDYERSHVVVFSNDTKYAVVGNKGDWAKYEFNKSLPPDTIQIKAIKVTNPRDTLDLVLIKAKF